jgi:hypothetical protein
VARFRREGKSCYDDGKRFAEIDPATLVAITDRS